jgi:hypothetical protein
MTIHFSATKGVKLRGYRNDSSPSKRPLHSTMLLNILYLFDFSVNMIRKYEILRKIKCHFVYFLFHNENMYVFNLLLYL